MSSFPQLIVLAAVAIFLILKLRSVLGTRDGFEQPPARDDQAGMDSRRRPTPAAIDASDPDITDHVPAQSPQAEALRQMKQAEPSFGLAEFLGGARGAYEMIVVAFEKGELDRIRPFLGQEVEESFAAAIAERADKGLSIEPNFAGIREVVLQDARYDSATRFAELTVRFVGELSVVVRDKAGRIVEGSPTEIKRQRDIWTFERQMGAADPNWQLVATGD